MAIKNVYCYQVASECDFARILLDPNYHQPLLIDKKNIEITYAKDNHDGTITGIFVATRKNGIAPAHKPGEEDFSAIPLKQGEGLAYPNVFLFSKKTGALLLEYNKAGVSAKNICEYFDELQTINHEEINLGLNTLLTENEYKLIQNLTIIE